MRVTGFSVMPRTRVFTGIARGVRSSNRDSRTGSHAPRVHRRCSPASHAARRPLERTSTTTTAPTATAGSGPVMVLRSLKTPGDVCPASLSDSVRGSMSWALPSRVTTRARTPGRSSCHGAHSACSVDHVSTASSVTMR